MKNKPLLLACIFLLAMLISAWAKPSQPGQAWEYKLEYRMNEKKANELGAQGWELAAIESSDSGGLRGSVSTYVFKRPK